MGYYMVIKIVTGGDEWGFNREAMRGDGEVKGFMGILSHLSYPSHSFMSSPL
jgi:hypothetical protein